jgi:hypothetical protein
VARLGRPPWPKTRQQRCRGRRQRRESTGRGSRRRRGHTRQGAGLLYPGRTPMSATIRQSGSSQWPAASRGRAAKASGPRAQD